MTECKITDLYAYAPVSIIGIYDDGAPKFSTDSYTLGFEYYDCTNCDKRFDDWKGTKAHLENQ